MHQEYQEDSEYPKLMDNNDPLGRFRQRFYLKKGNIYMCGNSLGLASKDAEDCILQAIEKWKDEAIKIWNVDDHKYYLYSNYLANLMAPLVGADPEEIAITGGTTINIHQAISTFYKPTEDRYKILVDDINFPTDRYAVDSQVRLHGYTPEEAVKVVKSHNLLMNEDDIINAMTDDVAIVLLPTVYYRSAQVLDMVKISKAAKEKGIIIGWDLCHAAGSIEVNLKEVDADFAMWCTYKYLNGGPGSAAALYINRKHFTKLPGLAGWFGNKHNTQFLLKQEFDHQQNASGWQTGTPSVFSMATLEGSLKIMNEAGITNIRRKSLHITGYLMFLIESKLKEYGFAIGNLKEDEKRGGHVCLEHDEGYRISMALKAKGVVPDFRDPNVIRLTPAALYTSYEEVYKMVDILLDIAKTESYKSFNKNRNFVV
ncbi:kynureninase-like [Anticarsia gemmatalis]|uniref:kynureninase-like n=1 Tax=Anticarsia gemmatalis TaxID=129554 RepID=UPI003F76BDAB